MALLRRTYNRLQQHLPSRVVWCMYVLFNSSASLFIQIITHQITLGDVNKLMNIPEVLHVASSTCRGSRNLIGVPLLTCLKKKEGWNKLKSEQYIYMCDEPTLSLQNPPSMKSSDHITRFSLHNFLSLSLHCDLVGILFMVSTSICLLRRAKVYMLSGELRTCRVMSWVPLTRENVRSDNK